MSSFSNHFDDYLQYAPMAATMLYKEYKDLGPWVGIGAYSAATLVATGRMMDNRHWMSDVLAGAGIGIMSTSVLAQISPAMGFRFYLEYVYTSLPYFETNRHLNYLNSGLAISALF